MSKKTVQNRANLANVQPATPRLVRKAPRPLALEQRFMFDGAAAADATQAVDAAVPAKPALLQVAAADAQAYAELGGAQAAAQRIVGDYLNQPQASQVLFTDFNGQQAQPDAQWLSRAQALLSQAANGELSVRVELRSSGELNRALGVFASHDATGTPVIFLNQDWLQSGASAEAIARVLIEEIGHQLDARLNGERDTSGDEGEAFARKLLGMAPIPLQAQADDHMVLNIDGQAVQGEAAAANLGVVQTFIVPMAERDIFTALDTINAATTNQIWAVISVTTTSNGARIVYDHWEDGYEADINNPNQATTEIWGDGDLTNGVAPGSATDLLVAGQVLTLKNLVDLTKVGTDTNSAVVGNQFYYDARDKIAATAPISVVRAGWADTPGTVLAGAVNVYDTGNAGVSFKIPVGENVVTNTAAPNDTANRLFEYTSLHIVATSDNTRVTIDKDGNAATMADIVTVDLNQGETYFVNGGVKAGATVVASDTLGGGAKRLVEVYSIAGDLGSTYENRWFSLPPQEQWSSSYFAPVYTTNTAAPVSVFLYNPGASAITVSYDTVALKGQTISVAANSTAYVSMPTTASGAHFYTAGGEKFYAVSTIDSDATANQTWDWSYSLVAENFLTTKFVVGWAPGNANTPVSGTNGSPVWVTATKATTLHIDYNGDGVADTTYDIKALESYRIFDPDLDQSGLTVWTTDGTLLAAAWGEDPSKAGAGTPYLDMGYTVMPFPDYVLTKSSVEYAGDGDGIVELGEQIEYTIRVVNRSVVDLFDVRLKDVIGLPNIASYVDGSARMTVLDPDGNTLLSIVDTNLTSTLEQVFAANGLLIDDMSAANGDQGLTRGSQLVFTYRLQLPTVAQLNADTVKSQALANAGYKITNTASLNGVTDTTIAKQTTNTTQVVLSSSDGKVDFMDSTYTTVDPGYSENQTLYVRVTDNDANLSTSNVDTLSVTVTNTATGETESVTLTETGSNTGIFRGALAASTAAADSANNSQKLVAQRGQAVKVDYVDPVYGASFDNPDLPGIPPASSAGNRNTDTVTIATPTLTKVLYLSSDSPNNLDRIDPVATGDNTTAYTQLIGGAPGNVVNLTDDFSSSNFSGGSGGWSSGWTELTESDGSGSGNLRVSNSALYLRDAGYASASISRSFTALTTDAALSFTIRNSSTSRVYEAGDYVEVWASDGTSWTSLGKVYGTALTTTDASKSFVLTTGTTAIKFTSNIADQSGGGFTDGGDRVYIDNVSIKSGVVSQANATGASSYAVSSSVSAGQRFQFDGTGAVGVDQLTLSLKKTSGASGTATVSVRSVWDGSELWSGTVSTASLSTSYKDVTLAVTGLTLDRGVSYYIRVDSTSSGISWQGSDGGTDVYEAGTRITNSGAAAAGDMRFAVIGSEKQLSSVSFSQALSMTSDFVMPAGAVVKVVTYVDPATATGLSASGQTIAATLSANGVTLASASSPVYDSVAGTLTWNLNALGSTKTVLAGQTMKLTVNNTQAGASFKIAYDSATAQSRIELPTTSVINVVDVDTQTAGVQEVGFFNQPMANGGGSAIGTGTIDAGGIVYIRVKVADPFGDYDVTSLDLVIDGPDTVGDITLNLADARVVNAANDGRGYKTYEYAWQTQYNVGQYAVKVTANEGFETGARAINDIATSSFVVTATDLGTPSTTLFLTDLGGADAGNLYATGAKPVLRVTDLDKTGAGTVTAVVNGYTVQLTETLVGGRGTGIFEADLTQAGVHISNTHADADPATYFSTLSGASVLNAQYTDSADGTDVSSDSITYNSAPVARNNTVTTGMTSSVAGNVITDADAVAGTDSDADAGQTLIITQVEGAASNVGNTFTLPSGATLTLLPNGSYIYDPTTLTTKPTSGTPVVNDTFSYTVSDGKGGQSTATVNLTVNYVNPTVIDNRASSDGATVEFDVSDKFVDIVADISYSATGLPAGLTIHPSTGIISGTLSAAASQVGSGVYTVAVKATELDANGNATATTTTRSFTWTVSNVAPSGVNDRGMTPVGTVLTGNVLSNDTDGSPDSDALTVSQFSIDTNGDNIAETFAAGSTATVSGVGTLRLNADGSYTFTPNASYAGNAPVATYTLGDGNAGSASATLSLATLGVNNITVNEASNYAVFSVSGAAGQSISLALVEGVGAGYADIAETQTLEVWNATTVSWTAFNGSTSIPDAGVLLVRVNILQEQDAIVDNAETFKLRVTAGTAQVDGTATIKDDGSGDIFKNDGTTDSAATKDDDRALTVTSPTVNEGSPYVVFTVGGVAGQYVKLGLSDGTALIDANGVQVLDGTEDYGPALQYFDGTAWQNYTANSYVQIPAGGTTLLVRTVIVNDTAADNGQTFKLTATNTGGTGTDGTATIKDDGTGTKWSFTGNTDSGSSTNGPGSTFDDDRALTVTSPTVNESSPYVVFTVGGVAGQYVKLGLSDGTALIDANGVQVLDGTEDYGPALQYFDGTAWQNYTANSYVQIPAGGTTLLVRTVIVNDTAADNGQTFKLTATNTGGTGTDGTATIKDDGTGDIFKNDGTTDPAATKDDDRPVTVSSPTVNEASPYAFFTVTGQPGQQVSLTLQDGTATGADYGPTLEVSTDGGTTWTAYTTGTVALNGAGGTLLVRTPIKQDVTLEYSETFKLKVTTTGGQQAFGTGTIVDEGNGKVYKPDGSEDTTTTKDDDRPKPLPPPPPPQPPAPPKPAEPVLLPEPPKPPLPPFNSVVSPLNQTLVVVRMPAPPIGDILTSNSGFRTVVNDNAPPGLTLNKGVTDQFVEGTGTAKVSMPADAFVHSKSDAVVTLQAKQASDAALPPWVQFDPQTGSFEVTAPRNFKGKLDVKVVARDNEGREATAIFRIFVGEQPRDPQTSDRPAPAGPVGRISLSEKLRLAAKRPGAVAWDTAWSTPREQPVKIARIEVREAEVVH